MRYTLASLLIGILLLGGCGGSSPSVKEQESFTGRDVLQAPSDSAEFFYAVGEGDDVTSAKNNALADISSRISVSISSSIDNRLSVSRENGIESSSQDIKTRVSAVAKTIEFSGVDVLQTKELEESVEVLVKVDRKILYQSYLKKLQRLEEKIQTQMDAIKRSLVFYQLKLSFHTRKNLVQAEEYLFLLEAMNPGFQDKAYRTRFAKVDESLYKINKSAVFSIQADKNSASLSTLIKERLSAENIKMSRTSANVKIQLSTKVELKEYKSSNSKISKMKIVIRTTTIKAVNEKGVTLSNNVIKTKAASSISKEEAISQTKQYRKLIDKEGILSFLSGNS